MNNLRLWENSFFENFSDVIIYFNGIKYKLNKQILSVSSTLRNLLQGGYEESFKDEINLNVEDISIYSWELLLNYIYDKYTKFYRQMFEINITDDSFYDLSTLTFDHIIELYVTSDYFDVPVLTHKLQNYIIDILSNLSKTNDLDLDLISSLIENLPSNSIADLLSIDIIIQIMDLCTNNNNYLCTNIIFQRLQKSFNIPHNLTNLHQLIQYLKERKIALSVHLSSLYIFTDTITEDLLLNYIILKYPNSTFDEINSIKNIINSFVVLHKRIKPPKISVHRRIRNPSQNSFDNSSSSNKIIPIDNQTVHSIIILDYYH